MNDSNPEKIFNCNDTLSVVQNPLVPFILILQIFLCSGTGMTNFLLIVLLYKTQSIHYNVRLLLGNLALSTMAYSGTMTGKCLYNVIVGFTRPCDLLMTNKMCKSSEIAVIGPLLANGYCLIVIGLERLYATAYYTTYESVRNRPLSILLAALAWGAGFTIVITTTASASQAPIPFCVNTLATNRAAAITYLTITCAQEGVAVLIYLVNLILNRRQLKMVAINRAQHTLTARFQLSANIEMCEMMLPTAIGHAASWMPVLITIVLCIGNDLMEFQWKVVGVLVSQVFLTAFCFFCPILFIYKNPGLKNELGRLVPSLGDRLEKLKQKKQDEAAGQRTTRTIGSHSSERPTVNHFDILGMMWESQAKGQKGDAQKQLWKLSKKQNVVIPQ